ncbi:MAG: hypothetical protein NWR96_05175 [Crocinitomicaceae bacterium]|jgi:cation transporter-like permease|nr:hypothetical protein [Crocinitomicaceae bacterium]
MKRTKNDWIALISFLFALWFSLTGIIWVYGAALIMAYPFGLTSFILWRFFLHGEHRKSKLIPFILVCGLLLSFMVLFFTWFFHS